MWAEHVRELSFRSEHLNSVVSSVRNYYVVFVWISDVF